MEPGRSSAPLDGGRWNPNLGRAHGPAAARAAAQRRPRRLRWLEPRRRTSAHRVGAWPGGWDASSGERLRILETSAASGDTEFSRDGSRLANTTIDERGYAVRLWDWPAGVETLKLHDSGLRVTLSPDGRLVATVRWRQPVPFVHVWALDPELLLRIARTRVTRSLTAEECRRYLQHACPEGR